MDRDESLAERAARIVTLVDGPVNESLAAVKKALDDSDQVLGEDFTVRLEQLWKDSRVRGGARRVRGRPGTGRGGAGR